MVIDPEQSSPQGPEIIDAEFEVKSGATKTEADPVRISPEEQAKLDQTFRKVEEKQSRQDKEKLRDLAESLEKAYTAESKTEKSSGKGDSLVKVWMMIDEANILLERGEPVPNIDQIRLLEKTLERYREETRLSGRYEDQKITNSLLGEVRKIISLHEELKTQGPKGEGKSSEQRKDWIAELRNRIEEQKRVIEEDREILKKVQAEVKEIEDQPWYKNLFSKFLGNHYYELRDKKDEVEKRQLHIEKLRKNLRSLEDDLEDAIKGA